MPYNKKRGDYLPLVARLFYACSMHLPLSVLILKFPMRIVTARILGIINPLNSVFNGDIIT